MKKKKIIAVLSVLLVLAVAFVFTGCKKQGAVMEKVQKSGKIVLGTCADYPPYEFHQMIDGKDSIIGIDIDIAREIAKGLGVEMEIVDMPFGSLIQSLKAGKVDYVLSCVTPDEKRKEQVDFTDMYYIADQAVIIRGEDTEKIKTVEDLEGKIVGAQMGTVQEIIAKEQIPGAEVKALEKVTDLIMELKHNKVEAVVMERPVAEAYMIKNPELTMSPIHVVDNIGGCAAAVAKGNEDLLEKMNEIIENLKAENKIEQFEKDAKDAMAKTLEE